MSLLVRPQNCGVHLAVNLENKEKGYVKDKYLCPNDGYVCFRNGQLISGILGKKTLGGESKSGLMYILIRDHGPQEAVR